MQGNYGAVKVVQLEGSWLQETLQVNEEKCNGDPLMPPFSSKIIYGLLKLTHFVHSQKLVQQGGHFYDKGEIKIRLRDDDEEGKLMGEYGPLTIMHSAELLKDTAALEALMREDNENANITMREDTMSAYGTVDRIITNLALAQNKGAGPGSQLLTVQDCLNACKSLLQEARFTDEMLLTLIRFRFRLSRVLSEVFSGHVSNQFWLINRFASPASPVLGSRVEPKGGSCGGVWVGCRERLAGSWSFH